MSNVCQKPGCVQLGNGTFLQNQDPVIVEHRVQPVGNRDDCAREMVMEGVITGK